ncbi:MAG: hypothetical protein ACTSUT_18475 [Promethearchaeota archaeon]
MKEKIYLLSYPRSGNTFTRYILETLTNYRSIGYPGSSSMNGEVNFTDKGVIIKRHGFEWCSIGPELRKEKESLSGAKLLLLIRNPLECIIRHQGLADVLDFCNSTTNKFNYFFENVKMFNEYGMGKKIIYYEDMISEPLLYIEELSKFVNNPAMTAQDFMKNYEYHFDKCRKDYGQAQSDGKTRIVYSSTMKASEKLKFWENFQKLIPKESQEVFERYISAGEA